MVDLVTSESGPDVPQSRPRFSVVTITRNDLVGLQSTWDSLRVQTNGAFEWVVVDGASTDDTVDWLASLDEPRLVWRSESDSGIYDAMNKGMSQATGDLIVFMNGGDRFASPDVLETVRCDQENFGWDWAYGASRIVDPDGSVVGFHVQAPFSLANLRFGLRGIPHQAAYFTRSLTEAIGGYDASFGIAGDQEFMLRAALLAEPHVIGEILAEFLSGGVSYGGRADRFVHETRQMRKRHDLLVGGNEVVDVLVTGLLSSERRARHLAASIARRTPKE